MWSTQKSNGCVPTRPVPWFKSLFVPPHSPFFFKQEGASWTMQNWRIVLSCRQMLRAARAKQDAQQTRTCRCRMWERKEEEEEEEEEKGLPLFSASEFWATGRLLSSYSGLRTERPCILESPSSLSAPPSTNTYKFWGEIETRDCRWHTQSYDQRTESIGVWDEREKF